MGLVYADIEIENPISRSLVKRGILDADDLITMHVNMLVDTGAVVPAINENLQEIFQFEFIKRHRAQLADGSIIECDVVGPVCFRFQSRSTISEAIVLPGNSEPLFGVIPMEAMDLVVHPFRNELIVNPEHPEFALLRLKKCA